MSAPLNCDSCLAQLRRCVRELSPAEALVRQVDGALLIDIREDVERAAGTAANALGLSRGFLELRIEQLQADRDHPVMLLCAQGQRSLLAAEALQRLGYRQVSSIAGGFDRWKAEGLPVAASTLRSEEHTSELQSPLKIV